jgi:hypothetical protein
MAQQRLPMRKIRDVLRLSAAGLSKRQIAASLGIGPTAAGACLRRAREAGAQRRHNLCTNRPDIRSKPTNSFRMSKSACHQRPSQTGSRPTNGATSWRSSRTVMAPARR